MLRRFVVAHHHLEKPFVVQFDEALRSQIQVLQTWLVERWLDLYEQGR